jgi:hypothetical protein
MGMCGHRDVQKIGAPVPSFTGGRPAANRLAVSRSPRLGSSLAVGFCLSAAGVLLSLSLRPEPCCPAGLHGQP